MNKLIKNGDIILNGTQTRQQAEKQAFKKLEEIEELLECWKIDSLVELNKILNLYWQTRTLKEQIKESEKELAAFFGVKDNGTSKN